MPAIDPGQVEHLQRLIFGPHPTFQGHRVDFFRLNETSLWYEMLTNPEGCCMKWSAEADYIMPILTPKFLMEIHGHRRENDADDFLPTSPILNR